MSIVSFSPNFHDINHQHYLELAFQLIYFVNHKIQISMFPLLILTKQNFLKNMYFIFTFFSADVVHCLKTKWLFIYESIW